MSPAKIVGRYELMEAIGQGGMAVVYLARQTDLDREVALKELRVFQAPGDPTLAQRFLREARVAGSLSHPNVVTVHEYFEHEGTPYIAMEYLERGSLRPAVGHMSVAQIAGVLEGVLAALDHAEKHNIVHRDLKPENLLITSQGQVKVADFGIAKARNRVSTNASLTAAGTTVGTPAYMAPEQAMASDLGPFTDLYSVGVMAYEFLVGSVPFHDTDTPVAIILRHVREDIAPAHSVNPAVHPALSDWIDRLLVKDPALRTQTAEQAWDELEEVVIGLVGSRWRRDARLLATSELPASARPLTPAPFTATDHETPVPESASDEFQSFAWGAGPARPEPPEPREAGPTPAPPPPAPDPPAPSPPAPVTPSPADPDLEPILGPSGFVTFGPSSTPAPPAPAPAPAPPEPPTPTQQPAWATYRSEAPDPPPPASPPPPPQPPASWPPVRAAERATDVPLAALPPTDYPVEYVEADVPTIMPDAIAEPAPPPSRPPREPSSRQWRYMAIAAGAILAIAAAVLVLSLAGSGGGAKAGTLSNDDIRLELSGSWAQLSDIPSIPGLTSNTTVAAAPGADTFVAAQLTPGNADPSLLPARLRSALRRRSLDPATIQLADADAYRYDAIAAPGVKQRLTIFAAPTTAGVATVACAVAPGAARSAVRQCADIAQTLTLVSAKRVPIGPNEGYDKTLQDSFAALGRRVDAASNRLARSQAQEAKAAALRELASAYRAAAAALNSARALSPVDAGLSARLATGFTRVSSAYGAVGNALLSGDGRAATRARARVNRLRARIRQANAALERAGYSQTAAVPERLSAKELREPRAAPQPRRRPQPPPAVAPARPPAVAPVQPPPVAAPPPPPPPPPASSGEDGGAGGGG